MRFGIKTGADTFFYVADRTGEALSQHEDEAKFQRHFGVSRADVARGKIKITRTGSGEAFPIEAKFLKPVLHSLMHIDRYTVDKSHCAKLAIMTDLPSSKLGQTHLAEYVKWGEQQGVHNRPTVKSRADTGRPWYDLTSAKRTPHALGKIPSVSTLRAP